MIEGKDFIEIAETYFGFLVSEHDFKIYEELENGNFFYRVRYINQFKAVTISYENVEDYLSVFVSILNNGMMPDYDDKTKTLHLNYLNKLFLSRVDEVTMKQNNSYFKDLIVKNEIERKLLKSAKELRLCFNFLIE